MKLIKAFAASFLLCVTLTTSAQELPVNFEFKRETGQVTGIPDFTLVPKAEGMEYDAMRGSTFEALGALTQPERDKYGLLFFNAKKEFQLQLQKAKGVLLKIDGEEFKIPEYSTHLRTTLGLLRIEAALIVINQKIFDRLVKANDVIIRVGSVVYNLDQDNIDAFRYYAAEIEKDISRRRRPQR